MKLSKTQVKELEAVLAHLDTLYDVGVSCMLPEDGECEHCLDAKGKSIVHDAVPTWLLDEFAVDIDEPIPDLRYDAMKRSLPADSAHFQKPTAANLTALKKIKLPRPMVSIDKACHEEPDKQEQMLFKWIADCVNDGPASVRTLSVFDLDEKDIGDKHHAKRMYNGNVMLYPRDYFSMSLKLDGCSAVLSYDANGKMVFAARRPRDGVHGDDITEHTKYIAGIPQQLPIKMACEVYGEVICKRSDFETLKQEYAVIGKEIPANPRNTTAGGLGLKDPAEVANRHLTFIAHGLDGVAAPEFKTEIERAKWVNKKLGIQYVRTEMFNFYTLESLERTAETLDYETDGIVVSVNNLEDQENLGRRGDAVTGNPKGKIAWKFAEEYADVEIKAIERATGRTGVIKFIAIFDDVELAGTQVGRATLHNIGFMKRKQIRIGTVVRVIKSGKIIPKVIGVISGQGEPDVPQTCPSCDHPATITHTPAAGKREAMWEMRCDNPNCPAQKVNNFLHFLKTLGVLGLGEAKVAKLIDAGQLDDRAQFYRLSVEDVMDSGFSEREALLAVANVWMIPDPEHMEDGDIRKAIKSKSKVTVPAWQFFAALGIPTAGKSAGKALVKHFRSFDAIMSATADELLAVEGVGDKTAPIVYKYLVDHDDEIVSLLHHLELELPKTGKFTNMAFCLTGSFPNGKRYIEVMIENAGGTCVGNVSKKVNYVVVGMDAGSKEQKADQLGIPKLSLEDLEKML
jgi:DNA ligase (NAD+)